MVPDHAKSIEDFVEISSDIFQVEAISQRCQIQNGETFDEYPGYEVQFI